MLLTCANCQNSFVIDDQLYAQQGGAICEQCHQPLMPVQDNGYGGQWGQQPMGAQMGGQWGQQPMGGQMGGQWGQQPTEAQWGQQPMEAQWGQQPMMSQWNNPTMDPQQQWNQQQMASQWGQQPMGAQMGGQWGQQPMEAQWGQQPMDAQWGQQPMDAQWGQQPMDAQWGQQPGGVSPDQWNSDAQWGQPAQNPMETQIFDEAISPVQHSDNNERTMALDAWNSMGPMEAIEAPAPVSAPTVNFNNKTNAPPGSVMVGAPLEPGASDQPTRQIDARAVQEIYGDEIHPVKEFIKSIPQRYLIIAAAVLGTSIIAFIIGMIVISLPEKEEKVFDEKGDIVTDVNAEKPKTFEDIVKSTKERAPSAMPFDGPDAKDGSIVAVTESLGVLYNDKIIGSYSDVEEGSEIVEKIYNTVKDDVDNFGKPIIFLFDEMLPMSVVYRTMYSFGATSRKILIGGTTSTGITTLEIGPCAWPDYGMTTFGDACKSVTVDISINRRDIIMRRIKGEESLLNAEEGSENVLELTDDIIGNKVQLQNISPALSTLRQSSQRDVRISPHGEVTFGVFMNTVLEVRGNIDNPNTKKIYLHKIPLR